MHATDELGQMMHLGQECMKAEQVVKIKAEKHVDGKSQPKMDSSVQ